jgi:hypothetical protein
MLHNASQKAEALRLSTALLAPGLMPWRLAHSNRVHTCWSPFEFCLRISALARCCFVAGAGSLGWKRNMTHTSTLFVHKAYLALFSTGYTSHSDRPLQLTCGKYSTPFLIFYTDFCF